MKKRLFLLIPEYHCLDKITENWVLFSKGGKSIIFHVFHYFHFLTPEKFLVVEVECHLQALTEDVFALLLFQGPGS